MVNELGLSSDEQGASFNAAMGMNVLAGSAVLSLTLIWPSVIVFGSYDLADDNDSLDLPQLFEEEPSFSQRLTAYGVTTDSETSYTARIMLVSLIPFVILQLPQIINSTSVTRVIVLVTLIITLSLFLAYIVYQIFQPWIQNRRFDYVRQKFVKNKLLKLLSTNGKANVKLIKDLYTELDKNHDGKVTTAELKTLLLGDEFIQEDEFIKIVTKWLQDARKSLSKNDYNPLSFFTKSQVGTDEEQQEALIPKTTTASAQATIWDYVEALALVLLGTAVTALVALPLITNVSSFASQANVPSFLIPYFIIPCAINIPRLLSTIASASQKTQRAASLTLSQIYSGVYMSNLSSLSTFLLTVYIRNLAWDVTAEVLVVLLICGVMGVFTSTRTIFPLWTGYVDVRSLNTLMDKENPWGKDGTGKDIELHLYRSMIGSLMYLTASRPDIMFAVCACARHQVTPKTYSDSDYGGASQDRKSTTGGSQFLGRRLISWQRKKQTIVATSTTEAEYVAAASYCGQVL
nr:sodium/calcium exchanger NCL2-like [Tanacetum cinerariifolium]